MNRFTTKDLIAFRNALYQLFDGNILDPKYGICRNAELHMGSGIATYLMVVEFSKDWEYHSGIPYYPVVEDTTIGKWEGVNRVKRRNLITHLRSKVSSEIMDNRVRDYKDQIREGLNRIKEKALNGEYVASDNGICHHLKNELISQNVDVFEATVAYRFVSVNATDWEHSVSPGNRVSWPVPDSSDLQLWVDHKLTLRLSLIDHLLRKLP